jgi:enoyl-CoA hydratase
MFVDAKTIVTSMVACRIPVVAAVNGPAVGLGCSIVALSDIVYIAESAHLADPHVLVGLVAADGGAITWPLLTSLQLAKEYAFTGDRITAERAAQIGLANHVVPDGEALNAALECAERLLEVPHQALLDTKRAMNMHLERTVLNVLDYALVTEDRSFTSDDTRAFLERSLAKKRERQGG